MTVLAEHPPINNARHAVIVAEITRINPRAWRVLYAPSDYVFDPCPICPTRAGKYPHDNCGLTLTAEMAELRTAFGSCLDWETAIEILKSLIAKDQQACRMSVGVRFGDRIIEGEAL